MGTRILSVVALMLVAVLLAAQPASAHVGQPLYTGHYVLSLKSQAEMDLQGNLINNIRTSLPKIMTLDISRGKASVTFRFQWTHVPLGADPNHYLFLMGFDLDDDGVWEDNDNNKYTLDDTFALGYLGFDIVTPPPCWICFNFPKGMYVFSWSQTDAGFKEIYTPTGPVGPGPQYPIALASVDFVHSATGPIKRGMAYSYTLTFTIPLPLFLRSNPETGFGFGLAQETGVLDTTTKTTTTTTIVWVWPPQTLPEDPSVLGDPGGAAVLGDLNLWGKPRR